jgi:hypothetical protein
MNVLPMEQQTAILSALVEGNSVRSTSRMSGAHIGTILALLKRTGDGCERLMDRTMRDLSCERLELDEIWGYVAMKQKRAGQYPERREQVGDFYCFIALDAENEIGSLLPRWEADMERVRCVRPGLALTARAPRSDID